MGTSRSLDVLVGVVTILKLVILISYHLNAVAMRTEQEQDNHDCRSAMSGLAHGLSLTVAKPGQK